MMRQGKVMRSWRQVTCGALGLAIMAAASSCSDVLGLDGMSVGSPSEEGDPCDACTQASCGEVLMACGSDSPAGCKAFYDCSLACEDDACVVGCYLAHPEGQVVVDCICSRCSTECSANCAGGGVGGGGGQAGGSGGASQSGGAGGS